MVQDILLDYSQRRPPDALLASTQKTFIMNIDGETPANPEFKRKIFGSIQIIYLGTQQIP